MSGDGVKSIFFQQVGKGMDPRFRGDDRCGSEGSFFVEEGNRRAAMAAETGKPARTQAQADKICQFGPIFGPVFSLDHQKKDVCTPVQRNSF